MNLEFEITEAHCNLGTRNNCFSCPAALALAEAYPDLKWRVRLRYVRALEEYNYREVARYALPADLSNSIADYDSGKPMKPGKYTIVKNPRAALDHYNGGPISKVRP